LTTRVSSVGEAHGVASDAFAHLEPPQVDAALAVGGSARGARKLVGSHLGPDELAEALHILERESERTLIRRYNIDRLRVPILPAGIVLLAEVQRRLGVPLNVCNGGIREGAVLEFAAVRAA
jgi:exopolyphosphatase/pppGpp-phosphohydrolase